MEGQDETRLAVLLIRRLTYALTSDCLSVMNKINQQVPGPLIAGWHGEFDACMADGADVLHVAEWLKFASQGISTARLARHAYTSYDAAGRALGIDATTLAQTLDLAALVRALHRLSVGLSGKSSDRCEWYHGIKEDAIIELSAQAMVMKLPQVES